jgi:protein-S-isoprenylcysteine O-methyltransferase Ste14
MTRSRILTSIGGLIVGAAIWFGVAGRLTWWQGWALPLVFVVYSGILAWRLARLNPDLAQERARRADAAEAWDRVLIRIYTGVVVVMLVIADLDSGRFAWSAVPLGVQALGWVLLIVTGAIVWHVMMINAYLSSWSRLQEDRGQVVIQDGLYRHVRHPMYLGIIIGYIGVPLVLGSWWALIPSAVIAGMFVYRTYREDKMLIEGLGGYVEYTRKVKYRLLPGIW